MFASQIVIDTSNFPDIWYILTHHGWIPAVLLVLLAAVTFTASVEIYKRRYSAKNLEKLGKKTINVLLAAQAFVFTALGYFLVFAGSNPSLLAGIPFVAEYSLIIIGTARTLYDLRLNKTFQTIANRLNKWSKSADEADKAKATPTVSENQPAASAQVTVDPVDRGLLS